jgi:hypothetical protein
LWRKQLIKILLIGGFNMDENQLAIYYPTSYKNIDIIEFENGGLKMSSLTICFVGGFVGALLYKILFRKR